MDQTRKGAFIRVLLLLTLTVLLTGCQTTPAEDPDAPRLVTPVGRVLSVSPSDRTVIITQTVQPFPSRHQQGTWYTRNRAGTLTALLTPTPLQRGRTLGFRLDEGLPNSGDDLFFLPDQP